MPPRNIEADGVRKARATLAKAGLDLPPIPPDLAPDFRERGRWNFATSAAPKGRAYFFVEYVQMVCRQAGPPFVVLEHSGHGINSYGLHYVLVWGPLRLFLQLGFGGVYMDPEDTGIHINECFRLAHELVDAVAAPRQAGCLSTSDPLVVAVSDFRRWHRFEHGKPLDLDDKIPYDIPRVLLLEALKRVGAQG